MSHREEVKEELESFLIDLMEEKHFGKPDDPYSPSIEFCTFATTLFGDVGGKLYDFIKDKCGVELKLARQRNKEDSL